MAADILPSLSPEDGLHPDYQAFISALRNTPYSGDIDTSYAGRIVTATDNSIYQQLPQAVLFPRTQQDVGIITALAASAEHQAICFSPRGGGTGTNGQSLTQWLVVDLSRHLTRILEMNTKEGWVRVEAGLVKDALNVELAKHGYFFAPDTSTSNRCTLGGMINTDASGQGSLVYGKTSDHVMELSSYTLHGTRLNTQPVPVQRARELAVIDTPEGQLYKQLIKSCVDLRGEVVNRFPKLNRFLTGYDLKHAYNEDDQTVDLSRLLTGSEGTLAIVTEAKLNITRIPQQKVLVNVKYSNFQAALQHAPTLVKAQATSVETLDSRVLNLARQDIVWHGVKDLITDEPGQMMDGINMVEFTATSTHALDKKLSFLTELLNNDIGSGNGVIGYQICDDQASIQRIYAMRKKAVGLLGATQGTRKPIAFVEDTAVPPEHLAEYITEFRALLDSHNLTYGMFGHVDAGVLHVRPALDMQDQADEELVRTISDQVVALTAKYGGLMWGEHGKGFRSEYGPDFFGEQLFAELRKIKAVFDPLNRLNPGKICTPIGHSDDPKAGLVSVDDKKRGWFDRQIPVATQQSYQTAMDCNGNGLCFNFDVDTPMCPSYRVTGDRRHSPKGRASLIREWLRLNENAGYSPDKQALSGSWWKKRKAKKTSTHDFNHEVKHSMDECLACKACSSQCPVKVDIPTHRANFLAHYHSRYPRPLKDYVVKNIEFWLPRMARRAKLVNRLTASKPVQKISRAWLGYEDMPELSVPPLAQRDSLQNTLTWNAFLKLRNGAALKQEERSYFVALVQDPYTSFYDANVVDDFLHLAARLGIQTVMLPYQPNGKAAHVKGFLKEFKSIASKQAALLNKVADFNLPMVGLDASTTLCYADEYTQVLGNERGSFQVKLVQEWLLEDVEGSILRDFIKPVPAPSEASIPVDLLLHCTEQTAKPDSAQAWQTILSKVGVEATFIATGCCGMAGTYGHESEHVEQSKRLYEMSWLAALARSAERNVQPLVTGFSCRCQVKRCSDAKLSHPLQLLLKALN